MIRPDDFDFTLPVEQIAQAPAQRRGDARMLVVLGDAAPAHHVARELPGVLPNHALVVVNDSGVVPARVYARCTEGRARGRRFELLVCAPGAYPPGARISAWVRGARRLGPGDLLEISGLVLRYEGSPPNGADPRARVFTILRGDLLETLEGAGEVPLPPYIQRPDGPAASDRQRYQTVYAGHSGSVAAPTAGLHWEPEVLARLDVAPLTLHVGPGTFLPMDVEDVEQHRVGAERVQLTESTAERIRAAQRAGRPIVAVGTTATRTLEAIAADFGEIRPYSGSVDRVITPRHAWRVVDILVTNFHLPRSSLLMLVCSLGGRERVLDAYRLAVAAGYRFYSYGDCMVVDRASGR
ncbi:MAG: tRNA preQ1(34) S-adenosylmethionine ribosyltransferase-isomerase QueA [Myxococcales bacterium]|nr:tRNA preQ1(34) S-adenosylmethionine ribosyltransferase-isomerase QueA [Myxococcales bacterium]